MDMYLIGSLILGLLITLFLVSKIAAMLQAKRPGMEWIFTASFIAVAIIVIGIFIVRVLAPRNLFEGAVDINNILLLSAALIFIFVASSIAFKYINQISWSGAITTNIASIVLGLIAVTAAIVLNGGSISDTLKTVKSSYTESFGVVEALVLDVDKKADQSVPAIAIMDNNDSTSMSEANLGDDAGTETDDNLAPVFTEKDLLPAGTVRELNANKKKVYVEPKYHVLSIGNIRSIVGKPIRILKKNGNEISGSLIRVSGSNAVVTQRIEGGIATTPISFAKIRKLEVYR